jgi:hypothetical protein
MIYPGTTQAKELITNLGRWKNVFEFETNELTYGISTDIKVEHGRRNFAIRRKGQQHVETQIDDVEQPLLISEHDTQSSSRMKLG